MQCGSDVLPPPRPYWGQPTAELFERVGSTRFGLSSAEAYSRLDSLGPNDLSERHRTGALRLLFRQARSPLLLLLAFAATVSALTGALADSAIVLAIVAGSVGISFTQEYRAESALAALRARIETMASVLRDGRSTDVPSREVVSGDIVQLSAGSLVPADAVVIEATHFFVNESILTGEAFPVEKRPGSVDAEAALRERRNCVHLGSNVRSGNATCVVVATGPRTQYGEIAGRIARPSPKSEFEEGISRFGYLVVSFMMVLTVLVFFVNIMSGRQPVETLLFAVALAVGLSPELFPAVLAINLSRGARRMAEKGVLVRRLNGIENLGSMDVLCTDKTGTLTEGVVEVEGSYDVHGERSPGALALAAINSRLQAGLVNPLDQAIVGAAKDSAAAVVKLGEIPFDFERKRISVIVDCPRGPAIITKGAFASVVACCTSSADGGPLNREDLERRHLQWSRAGTRVLAVARRSIERKDDYSPSDESNLELVGFVAFSDRPKNGAAEAIRDLRDLGVTIKLITGDNAAVAAHVAQSVGLRSAEIMNGAALSRLSGKALIRAAMTTDIFAEVDPSQKETIILALRHAGHVVGFMGDGINDAPAMHSADTSISVDRAVDVAREAADFVLLEQDLQVIHRGIEEGRQTFANSMKYVQMTMSANLGNMLSMALASLFLPFLPLLASQILLNNFLSDIPALTLANDSVDDEMVERPHRWNIRFVGRFMVVFGAMSSCFDLLTFAALLRLFGAVPEVFRTGWFLESLLTEIFVVFVIRTRRPLQRSRPSSALVLSTAMVSIAAITITFIPVSHHLGFTPPAPSLMLLVFTVTLSYLAASELAKRLFYLSERHERPAKR